MDAAVNDANRAVSVGADFAYDAVARFFACVVRFESSAVPTSLLTAYDLYPLDGRDFFFSSRRRHTRLTYDWSSDVCSSDLPLRDGIGLRGRAEVHQPLGDGELALLQLDDLLGRGDLLAQGRLADRGRDEVAGEHQARRLRSEERRVGEEGGYRGWEWQLKKK